MVAGILAMVLIVLGVPHLFAALYTLNAREVLWDVRAGESVAPAALAGAAADLASARHWVSDGEYDTDRGFLLLRLALSHPPGLERQRLLDEATTATMSGLALAPGQPDVWARLAYLRESAEDNSGAVKALQTSWLSGRFQPELMASRLEQAFHLLPAMDKEAKSLLRQQIRMTWVATPSVVSTFSGRPDIGSLVREALSELTEEEIAQYLRSHGRKL